MPTLTQLTVPLNSDSQNRRFNGPNGKIFRGIDNADDDNFATMGAVLTKADGITPLFGQQLAAASLPVVLASDTIPPGIGSLTETSPGTDTSSSGLNGRLQRLAQHLTVITSLLPSTLSSDRLKVVTTGTVTADAGTNLNTSALNLETTQSGISTRVGGVTETAPGTDTASSGLNGRLQRLAQHLTTLTSLFPSSLGQKTMANSLGVAIASNQSALSVDTEIAAALAAGDAISNPTTGGVLSFQHQYDAEAATWIRKRANYNTLVLNASAVSADQASPLIHSYNGVAVILTINVSAAAGGQTVTPKIDIRDDTWGGYMAYAAFTNIATTGQFVYVLGVGATGGAVTNSVSLPVPVDFRILMDISGGTGWSFTVRMQLITNG